jgi:hypothetical protein
MKHGLALLDALRVRAARQHMRLAKQNCSFWVRTSIASVAGAFPLNDARSRSVSPIMIVGCGRSGNTLLRSMLVRGGEIAIPPESYVWPAVARGFSQWRFSDWEAVTSHVVDAFEASEFRIAGSSLALIKAKAVALPEERRSLASILNLIYETYCDLNGYSGRRWGDKTPFNILDISVLQDIFPAAQYVHIVRDPRAVSLSIVKAAQNAPGIRERSFDHAAKRWVRSVRNAEALGRRVGNKRCYQLRYEDLVRAPESELLKLCTFLGQTYSSAMLSFYEGTSALGDVPTQSHHARVQQPLDASRSESWRDEISPADCAAVDAITSKYRERFGYA